MPRRREEEVALRMGPELMDEDAEAARGVAESSRRLGGGEPFDEEGPEGFVLPVCRVGRLQEPADQC